MSINPSTTAVTYIAPTTVTSVTTNTVTSTALSTVTSVSTNTVTSTTTNTVTSTQTNTQVSTSVSTLTTALTYSTTYTNYQTVTTTSSIYPPSNSTYALTFVSGNITTSATGSACTWNYYVDVTYEMHQQIPQSGVVVWVQYPNGQIADTSPTSFANQAYLTLDASFTYAFPACPGGWSSISTWITGNTNNVLSPTTTFIVT